MLIVLAIPELDAIRVNRFLADGTGLRRIGHCRRNQRMLNLLRGRDHRDCIFPIHRDLKRHLNGRLTGRRRKRQRLKELLHRLAHGNLIVGHSQSILTVGMAKEHTKKGLITARKLAEGFDLLHCFGCVPSS